MELEMVVVEVPREEEAVGLVEVVAVKTLQEELEEILNLANKDDDAEII